MILITDHRSLARWFLDTKVIFRLVNNLLFHKDFQFPY